MQVRNLLPDAQKHAHTSFPTHSSSSEATSYNTFDDLLASYRMPPPGPDYFRARQQLWLTPRSDRTRNLHQSHTTTALKRLDNLLQDPEAVYSDSCWKKGIERVWKGLSKGERLKHRLPLNLTVKVLHASWVRDETWPAGMRAPEPDDDLPEQVVVEPMLLERIDDTNSCASATALLSTQVLGHCPHTDLN